MGTGAFLGASMAKKQHASARTGAQTTAHFACPRWMLRVLITKQEHPPTLPGLTAGARGSLLRAVSLLSSFFLQNHNPTPNKTATATTDIHAWRRQGEMVSAASTERLFSGLEITRGGRRGRSRVGNSWFHFVTTQSLFQKTRQVVSDANQENTESVGRARIPPFDGIRFPWEHITGRGRGAPSRRAGRALGSWTHVPQGPGAPLRRQGPGPGADLGLQRTQDGGCKDRKEGAWTCGAPGRPVDGGVPPPQVCSSKETVRAGPHTALRTPLASTWGRSAQSHQDEPAGWRTTGAGWVRGSAVRLRP